MQFFAFHLFVLIVKEKVTIFVRAEHFCAKLQQRPHLEQTKESAAS